MEYPLIDFCLDSLKTIPKKIWPEVAYKAQVSYSWMYQFVRANGAFDTGYKKLARLEDVLKYDVIGPFDEQKIGSTGYTSSNERDEAICADYKTGMTLAQVGSRYGITRERVRQIVTKRGITKMDGGGAIRSFKKTHEKIEAAAVKEESRERRCLERFGCTCAQKQSLRNMSEKRIDTPIHKFSQQRMNALTRNIEWDLTLWEWWQIWNESGKYSQRGKEKGQYVMARYGDHGGYTKENSYITTAEENIKDGYAARKGTRRAKWQDE
jgi:hypothetical protein